MNVILAQTTVQEVFEAFQDRFWVLSGAIIWVVCWAVPVVALSYGIYFLISLPLRRQERARMLLDLVRQAYGGARVRSEPWWPPPRAETRCWERGSICWRLTSRTGWA